MNFHETQMGKMFFQGQLPKLIAALNDIAQGLKQPQSVYQLDREPPPEFLADLFNGNYIPSEEPVSEAYRAYSKEIAARQSALRDQLSDQAWEQVQEYMDLLTSRGAVLQEQSFAAGFRCAVTMFAAGLSVPKAGTGP